MELAKAVKTPYLKASGRMRRWSEELFGNGNATLDRVLDHYAISRAERDEKGHGAILDARLLSDVYPLLLKVT